VKNVVDFLHQTLSVTAPAEALETVAQALVMAAVKDSPVSLEISRASFSPLGFLC